ncbi:hypothetical protein ACQ4PT_068970 [Festuca glaucescens]
MALLAAVRRNACRLVSGSGRPPSLVLVRATKSVNAAHADACRAWEKLFARGTPSMAGAESELCLAQYFYDMATPLLARSSGSNATSHEICTALRAATADLMDGSAAVLRACACLRGDPSATLRDGASCYFEGATDMLRASGSDGEHAAWFLDASARRIAAAGTHFHSAVAKIQDKYVVGGASADWDLINQIDTEVEAAQDAKVLVKEALQNFPFEIKDKHSCTDLILTRKYGDEDIEVVVSAPFLDTARKECNWHGSVADSSADEAKSVLALQVTVSKGGSLSMFTCTASEGQVEVRTVYMRLTVGEEDKEEYQISFEGEKSNQVLQQLVNRYLELRGVTMLTAAFLHELLSNKDVFVSIFWLDMLKGFVRQSA